MVERDTANHRLVVTITHLTEFALLGREMFIVRLPPIFQNHIVAPDLVVESVMATNDDVVVVVKNQGNAAVVDEFWVDVYIAPAPAPSVVNQVWWDLAGEGLAWGVTASLQPSETLTLMVEGAYYVSECSEVAWPLGSGTEVYAQVDSADAGTTTGAVLESHEITGGAYNNVAGPVLSTAAVGAHPRVRPDSTRRPGLDALLPIR